MSTKRSFALVACLLAWPLASAARALAEPAAAAEPTKKWSPYLMMHGRLQKRVDEGLDKRERDKGACEQARAAVAEELKQNRGKPGKEKKPDKEKHGKLKESCEVTPAVDWGTPEEDQAYARKDRRKIKSVTTFRYAHPGQRRGVGGQQEVGWERLKIRRPGPRDLTGRHVSMPTGTRSRAGTREFLPGGWDGAPVDLSLNADGDCIERATKSHLSGADCLEGGQPRASVEWLVDEDPASALDPGGSGRYDTDGDGQFGEDGPEPNAGPTTPAVNDDRDCLDRVTGAHLRDGECFAGAALLQTRIALDDYSCKHVSSGEVAEGNRLDGKDDECWDAAGQLKTTLVELVNEDDGRPVDDDGDGAFDEDGPTQSFDDQCRGIGRQVGLDDLQVESMLTPDGCDLTPVAVRKINQQAAAAYPDAGMLPYDAVTPTLGGVLRGGVAGHRGGGLPPVRSGVDANAGGYGEVPYGEEVREVELTEEMEFTCDPGLVIDDETGSRVEEGRVAELEARRAAAAANGVLQDDVLMGFTFAPPRIRWGIFEKEEACFWIFGCFTLYEVKAGFDFAIGVGFRLPMRVTVSGIPQQAVLAGSEQTLASTIEPLDFTASDYEQFCLAQADMGRDPAYCRRFAFPDALDPVQGDELVLRLTAFAGVKVVIVEIPIVNFGLDIDKDAAEMCSLGLGYLNWEDVAKEMVLRAAAGKPFGLGKVLTEMGMNCGTFQTPYGYDENGDLRNYPFVKHVFNKMLRADCLEAYARGETIMVGGEPVPLCTGLVLGVPGASLGLGLGAELVAGSTLARATLTAEGDARVASTQVEWNADSNAPVALGPVTLDNYDGADNHDEAVLRLGGYDYCLNEIGVRLKGQAMFGGLLTFLPSFDEFTIYEYTIPGIGCEVKVGQHARTDDTIVRIPVRNHALEVLVRTDPVDPLTSNEITRKVKPGEFAPFTVAVKNLGSVSDDFVNFRFALSNALNPTVAPGFQFRIEPDNDGDLRVDEDGFGPAGATFAVRDEDHDGKADEDPPDDWRTLPGAVEFAQGRIEGLLPYRTSELPGQPATPAPPRSLLLSVSPFRHPSTKPGLYAFEVQGDSAGALQAGLAPVDPSGHARVGASAVGWLEVQAFRDVRVVIAPPATSVKPGLASSYAVEGSNMGNVPVSMSLAVAFPDSNTAGCGLATLGASPGCPFRAQHTRLDPAWTSVASLRTSFGPLEPLDADSDRLDVVVPRDWRGMQDTPYEIAARVEAVCDAADTDCEAASGRAAATHTVIATKESMVRFLQLEVAELLALIQAADSQGEKPAGTLPITLHPLTGKLEQALELVLSGDLDKASQALKSARSVLGAFGHALDAAAKKLPEAMVTDWRARAGAMEADLVLAQACQVTSAP